MDNQNSSNSISYPINFWKNIWKLNLSDRLKLFLWNIARNIVPTKTRIASVLHTPNSDDLCPLCKVAPDSLHLFLTYLFAIVVWRNSFWPFDSSDLNFSNMMDWIDEILFLGRSLGIPQLNTHLFQIFASVACDLLWFYRNKSHHDGSSQEPLSISMTINKVTLDHQTAWSSKLIPQVEKWISPPLNWYKINFDTAMKNNYSAQVVVCQNNEGKIICMVSQLSDSCSSNVGETLGAQLASSLATSLKIERFILEGDIIDSIPYSSL